MSMRRQFAFSVALAVLATLLLVYAMTRQRDAAQRRFAIGVTPHPAEGRELFQQKGCATCHGPDASGTERGPALRGRASLTSLPKLVTAMWNHAPRMYEAMRQAKLPYPDISYDETAHLAGYLYVAGFTDEAGDPKEGARVFTAKQCTRCHAEDDSARRGAATGPGLKVLARAGSPIAFTQALWNHASGMQAELQRLRLSWPHFQASELRDLFAYVQQAGGAAASANPAPDLDRGWRLFQEKGCLDCHSLRSPQTAREIAEQKARPILGADGNLPPTFSEFGERLLNHFPVMNQALGTEHKSAPVFHDGELADITGFLYSLRYLEPAGSPNVGASIFVWRQCADCHGKDGEGTARGPALRGRGQTYTSIRLATDLWRHGESMFDASRKRNQAWPTLQESDVGDLLSFLNTPLDKK
jgi:mono/diheme cytochrome c family protein